MDIPNKKENKKRYDGLHPKLIHLEKDTFTILDTMAKMKGWNLKEYIEYLCLQQAKVEAYNYITKNEPVGSK